jgi:hypothetical protein
VSCAPSERVLRSAIIDLLCSPTVGPEVGGRLRRALNDSRKRGEHPEDLCEECREPFVAWHAPTDDWERVTGKRWGGPILCRQCFAARLERAL